MVQVCRMCLEELTAERNYFHIYGDARSSQILSQLSLCLPEMSLSLVKDPVICITCLSMLHLAYNFKQKCLGNEVHLKRMLERLVPGKEFTLAEIVQISKHKVIDNPVEDILDTKIGMHDFLKDMDAQMLGEIEKQECIIVKVMTHEEFWREETLNASDQELQNRNVNDQESQVNNASDQEPQINNENDQEPQINNASDQEPQINNANDQEPQINNASDQEPQINAASDQEPQINNASDQEPQINAASDQEPQIRNASDQEPQNTSEINIEVSSNMLPNVTMVRLPEFIGLDTVSLNNLKPVEPQIASQVSLRKASGRAKAVSSKKTKKAPQGGSRKKFQCESCDYSSNDRPNLRRHTNIHRKRPVQKCLYCDFQTKSNQYFRTHMKMHVTRGHTPKTATLQAEEPKQTNTERPFACESCAFATKTRKLLSQHKKVHLKQTNTERLFACETCGFATKTRKLLSQHKKVHLKQTNTERPFACETCGFATKTRKLLSQHKKVHLKQTNTERPFACESCGFATKTRKLLGKHKKVHLKPTNTEPPFGCETCGFATKTRKLLGKHKKVHLKKLEPQANVVTDCVPDSSIKARLECEVCKYKTNSRALFASHLEACGKPKQPAGKSVEILSCSTSESSATDKENPFGCIVCDYTTHIRSNLVKHMCRHKNSPKIRTSRVLKKYEFVHSAEPSELVNGA